MNFNGRRTENREYLEMIYSLLTEMNGAIMAQVRAINNSLAKMSALILSLQDSLDVLNTGLKETRDRRYQEEIDQLETQIDGLRRQVEEKRNAKSDPMSTSQEIRSVALETFQAQQEAERKRKSIDWIDVRNKVLPYILGGLAMALVLYGLPWLGRLLIEVFSP